MEVQVGMFVRSKASHMLVGMITLGVATLIYGCVANAQIQANSPKYSEVKPVHDIAVVNLTVLSKCTQADTIPIMITVENRGSFPESFDVELTDVTNDKKIGTKSVTLSGTDQREADADLTFSGEASGKQQFGDWLAVGNVNGDGCADLLVSAAVHDNDRGRAYLYHGRENMDNNVDRIFEDEIAGDYFGDGGGYLADMNKDGFDDVIIGARYFDDRGRVYLFYGGPDMDIKPDIIFEPEEGVIGSSFGRGVAAGDLNGDGYNDLIVSAPLSDKNRGCAYLFFGGELFDTTIDKVFVSEGPSNAFGAVRSARGDVDGDGYNDLLIGTRYGPNRSVRARGCVYLFYGAPGTEMDTKFDIIFEGENDRDEFGTEVDLFDIDNDGHADVIVSARRWNNGEGRVYLFWGSDRNAMDNVPDMYINGEPDAREAFGGDHVVAGYANDDPYGDIVVPAFDYYRFSQHGRTYLFHGGTRSSIDNICDQTFTGANPGNLTMDARIADFNGDNRGDIVIGGWGYPNNTKQGRVWLYYGGAPCSTSITFNWDTTTTTPGKHTLQAAIAPVAGEADLADNSVTVEVEVKDSDNDG